MEVEILMSTMNKNDIADLNLKRKNIQDNILIINQIKNQKKNEELKKNNEKIRMIFSNTIGLSKSRNLALKKSKGDICLISDDDNSFVKNYKKKIKKSYKKYKDADVITYIAITPDGAPIKSYKNYSFKHTKYSILSVSSWEISFKRKSIINKDIKFDCLFGLGAKYPQGEENIFLSDCLKNGLNIRFVPIKVSKHPDEKRTGEKYTNKLIKAKGAVFARIYGIKSLIINFMFVIRKCGQYSKNISFTKFVKIIYKGSWEILKNNIFKKEIS